MNLVRLPWIVCEDGGRGESRSDFLTDSPISAYAYFCSSTASGRSLLALSPLLFPSFSLHLSEGRDYLLGLATASGWDMHIDLDLLSQQGRLSWNRDS